MSPGLRFGIMTLQNIPYASMVERWRTLDALAFDSVRLGDHFLDPFRPTEPWFDGWTLLAALAVHTSRIRIGTLVSSITPRNPALLAREAMTVDRVSHGRRELGDRRGRTSTGPHDDGQRDVGICRAIVDRVLRHRVTSFEGRWYRIQEAEGHPAFPERGLQGVTITDRAILERVASEAIPAVRDAG